MDNDRLPEKQQQQHPQTQRLKQQIQKQGPGKPPSVEDPQPGSETYGITEYNKDCLRLMHLLD